MTYDKEQYNNLLERLDPKYMAILDEVAQTYPYSVTITGTAPTGLLRHHTLRSTTAG